MELAPGEPLDMDICPVHELEATRYVWNTHTVEWDEAEWDDSRREAAYLDTERPEDMPAELDY